MLLSSWSSVIYVVPAVLIAISLHEFAHGLASYGLGDPTPKAQGRLSLNPLHHLDIVGTLMLLFVGFGWAKPVEVDPRYYTNKKSGMVKVALAGPIMNFFIGFICMIIIAAITKFSTVNTVSNYFYTLAYITAVINIGLGLFNLIPIPPLDGSKVLGAILPTKYYFSYMQFERYGMFLLLILIYLGTFNGFLYSARETVLNGMQVMAFKIFGL